MIKKNICYFIRIICIFLLSACGPVLTLSDVSNLRKGMSPTEAKELSVIEPKHIFNFEHPETGEDNILIYVYELTSGTHSSNYLYMFVNNELYFWGYPHEFSRSNNSLINEINKLYVKKNDELETTE